MPPHDPVGWRVLRTEMSADELRKVGPTIKVQVADRSSPAKRRSVYALVDTGASHSHASPRLRRLFTSPPAGAIRESLAGRRAKAVPVFAAVLTHPSGLRTEAKLGILPNLQKPHDLLIGRDILGACRVLIDFAGGVWELAFKVP